MKIIDLEIKNLDIPFKVSFDHSSASRTTTEAILVTVTTKNGNQGIGEGCPRSYVTGETLESAHLFFNAHRDDFLGLSSLDELKDWITHHQTQIDQNPAAFCAVEIALLNAIAQEKNITIERLLSLPKLSGRFRYTGVLGSRKSEIFTNQLKQYLKLGFNDLKIKLFGKPEIDYKNIAILKSTTSDDIRVRLDANNLWSNTHDAIQYIQDLDYSVFALEEPLTIGQYQGSNLIAKTFTSKIILDESFTKGADFNSIDGSSESWIINIRISKMGGILRSLAIANQALNLGIPIIIGAQVGETSILTRAALTVANSYRDLVVAQEGAFGTHLLQKDITEPSITFGAGGWLNAKNL